MRGVRRHYAGVHSARQQAGVGGQSDECKHGTTDCPGPNAETGVLPCLRCLLEYHDNDSAIATDGGERRE